METKTKLLTYVNSLYDDIKRNDPGYLESYINLKKVSEPLRGIYHNIQNAHHSWNLSRGHIISKNRINTQKCDNLPKMKNFEYLEEPIKMHIEEHSYSANQFEFTLGERKYEIFIVLEKLTKEQCLRKVKEILKDTYIWLHVLQNYAKINNTGSISQENVCSKTVNIFLYMTSLQKTLPASKLTKLDQNHINTGFTTGCSEMTEICIFRQEEWFKVLIHESFHNSGLDFIDLKQEYMSEAEAQMRELFPVNVMDLRLYESYCETWGEILNDMFIVFEKQNKNKNKTKKRSAPHQKNDFSRWLRLLSFQLNKEVIFSCMQLNKLLDQHDIGYFEMSDKSKAATYTESTQCFSYFFLKSILLTHYLQFFEFCAEQSAGFSLDFELTREHVLRYVNLFKTQYNSERMKYYMELTKNTIDDPLLPEKKNMRMSLFGN
uniref:Uncharacterized protein n=1 Tax=viral metagenome TaxID=1070528 RepID=A0A6C0HIL9_9ZZZZ